MPDYPRVAGVLTRQGSDWSVMINTAADAHACPPQVVLACTIAECGLDETCEPGRTQGMARYGTWPDISFGPGHQTVAYAPYGDQTSTPANIEACRVQFCGDLPYAFDVMAAQLGRYWAKYGDGPEALGRYNWPARGLQGNPNRANIEQAWARSAAYVVAEEPTVAQYVFPIVRYQGPVNTHWGTGERGGSDLFAARGSDVVAMHPSRVTYAGYDNLGGWCVMLAGEDGLTYYYAHLDGLAVQGGQQVGAGHRLGPLGDSGNAQHAGPHLHIGIGYGIQSGGGPSGGCGINYDAVGLLQRTLTGEGEGEDMARIAELEAELAGWEAWWEGLHPAVKSWAHALDDARADREGDGWTEVRHVSEQLHEHFTVEG